MTSRGAACQVQGPLPPKRYYYVTTPDGDMSCQVGFGARRSTADSGESLRATESGSRSGAHWNRPENSASCLLLLALFLVRGSRVTCETSPPLVTTSGSADGPSFSGASRPSGQPNRRCYPRHRRPYGLGVVQLLGRWLVRGRTFCRCVLFRSSRTGMSACQPG